MSGSRSRRHADHPESVGRTHVDVEAPRGARSVGLAAAGIACLTLIGVGVVVTGLVANGLTREYGGRLQRPGC